MPDDPHFTCPSCGKASHPKVYANANGPFVRCPHCEAVAASDPNNAATTAYFDRAARMDAVGVAPPDGTEVDRSHLFHAIPSPIRPQMRKTARDLRYYSAALSTLFWVFLAIMVFMLLRAFFVMGHHIISSFVPFALLWLGIFVLGLLVVLLRRICVGVALLLESHEARMDDKDDVRR